MYISPNDPLPRNSADGQTTCEAARAKSIVNGMEQSVANARWASSQIASPESFAGLGPVVVNDARQQQSGILAAQQTAQSTSSVAPSVAQEVLNAPRVLPLNVTEAEYGSCCTVKDPKPMQLAPQVLTMPKRMPAPLAIPQYGMAGYRKGMGAAWGDAGTLPSTQGWPPYGGLNWKMLAILAAVGAGIYAVGRK